MFDAYEQLCALGAEVPPTAFFGAGDVSLESSSTVTAPLPLPTLAPPTVSSAAAHPPYEFVQIDDAAQEKGAKKGRSSPPGSPSFRLTPTSRWATPTPALASVSQPLGSIFIDDETLTPKGKRKKRAFSSARKSSKGRDRDRDREDDFDDQGPRHVPNAVCGSIAVLSLLRKCGEASLLLSQYRCKRPSRAQRLPQCHLSTGWAMQSGKGLL